MFCPRCNGNTKVNRTVDLDYTIERNRRCTQCGRYFDTVEILKNEFEKIISTQSDDQKPLWA